MTTSQRLLSLEIQAKESKNKEMKYFKLTVINTHGFPASFGPRHFFAFYDFPILYEQQKFSLKFVVCRQTECCHIYGPNQANAMD